MSIGFSIFLSSLVLACIALFIATKDRWNWTKLILWPLGIGLILSLVGGLWLYISSVISQRPKLQQTFWDIPLTATKSDVRFMKGEPTEIEAKDDWSYYIEKDNNGWSLYQVRFQGDHIRLIAHATTKSYGREYLQGIGVGYGGDAVREKFGEPSHVSESKNGLTRIYSYEKYNVFFTLQQNAVSGLGIYNPQMGPVKIKD